MNLRLPSVRRGLAAAAVCSALLPALAAVATPATAPTASGRVLAAWSAPEPMDYGLAMAPKRAAWSAPEPMDYGVGAYPTLAQFERGDAPATAVASR